MRKLERGASYIPLIIVIVLLVVAVVWAYIKTDELDQTKRDLVKAKAALELESQRRVDVFSHLNNVSEKVGWKIDPGTPGKDVNWGSDDEKIQTWIQEKLGWLRDKYVREFPTKVYSVDPNGGIAAEESADKIKVEYVQHGRIPNEAMLEDVFNLAVTGMDRMLFDIGRLVGMIETEKARYETAQSENQQAIQEKNSTIDQLRGDHNNYVAQAATRERDLQNENLQLEERRREAEEALKEFQKEAREREGQMKNTILAKEQDVRKLIKRQKMIEEPIGPDGEVLAVTAANGLIVLNRGKAHHLMPGTTFQIYNFAKGARKVAKGTAVVIEVDDNSSVARIEALMSPMNPIVQGDMIESVTYNPDQKLNFYLLGRFRKFGASDAAKRLQSVGVNVESKVSVDTDYLVLGAPEREDENLMDTEAYKLAKELGITILTEAQLSRFLLY